MRTLNEIIRTTTMLYLDGIDENNPPPPIQIEKELLTAVKAEVLVENTTRDKGDKIKAPQALSFAQIADIMLKIYPICKISCTNRRSDSDYDLLGIYQTEGRYKGLYATDENAFREIALLYNYQLTQREMTEILVRLNDGAKKTERTSDPDLIAVNNGIFNYKTKQLQPFTPNYVFISKSKVDYNPNAVNINIHNDQDNTDWDVETWVHTLSDDDEVVNLIWEILGAIIRPHVKWDKSAWFYSETGNNGKGTLCELMRNLCGDGTYATIPISDFSKDFMLEPLVHANAIIVDENDVGQFIDRAGNLKAVITNDVIMINRKFKAPIPFQFFGFMVQCLNEMPRIKDKSNSFYRRQLFVPFTKTFTGKERTYIKHDYLKRPEVLEYVLYKVLNMNYYRLSEPAACTDVLSEYKEYNDPVRLFVDEILPQCKWDLLPFTFLYDVYKEWFKENIPSGQALSSVNFTKDIITVVNEGDEWICKDKQRKIRAGKRMNAAEPLIIRYQLKNWYNPYYHGNDPDKIALPALQTNYRGLERNIKQQAPITQSSDE